MYAMYIEPNLLPPERAESVHEWLNRYASEPEAEFIVREIGTTNRDDKFFTRDGTCILPSDNSPTVVLQGQLFRGELKTYAEFREALIKLPRKFHASHKRRHANDHGWYVAHIVPAKNGDTNFKSWNRAEVVRRFLVTLHPCNLFLVPKAFGASLGENADVIEYMASHFAARYRELWNAFLVVVSAPKFKSNVAFGEFALTLNAESGVQSKSVDGAASYHASRLTFKKAIIESLAWDESFTVFTKSGSFRMTKREFYDAFPNVAATASYRDGGSYNYSVLPAKAERFRI